MGLDELYDRLEEMVMVCHSFPSPLRKQKLSFWPEYANDANLAYGYNQTTVSIKKIEKLYGLEVQNYPGERYLHFFHVIKILRKPSTL